MKQKPLTFSHQVKDELSLAACADACCRRAEIGAAFYGAARFSGQTMALTTAHQGCAARLTRLIREQYRSEVCWQAGREWLTLNIADPVLYRALSQDMIELFGFDPAGSRAGPLPDLPGSQPPPALELAPAPESLPACCRQAILRALFLVGGSISQPEVSYHLEFSIRQSGAARMAIGLLGHMAIRTGMLIRHGCHIVYIKEGQFLAEFLLQTGAHHSLLAFESLRVEKEMRNSVNRVVNCDSANIQRIANTSARQLELISRIREPETWGLLPPDLQQAAEIRLDHPDLSLKELGEMMEPKLGKSGMNHRLKRLENLAAELLNPKGENGGEP
ncbi:MAG TPA: DNA-binding protein WhiA [Clostridiales bacterium]|nr:DNA-binding protein WhiA [Clostridiales bacterium]